MINGTSREINRDKHLSQEMFFPMKYSERIMKNATLLPPVREWLMLLIVKFGTC